MKVLGQICALNDADVIHLSLQALSEQTYPVNEILIVDNGSTDDTLNRQFPHNVTVIRHAKNLGTSGGAYAALKYGTEHGYDWVWILDADSAPSPDALEKLLAFYGNLPPEAQARVRVVACLPFDVNSQSPHHGIIFTPNGYEPIKPDPLHEVYACDTTIWSGSLFRVEAVKDIGLPCLDYMLDWGENEYGYRGMRKGYLAYVHCGCVMQHNIGVPGGRVGPKERVVRIGPFRYRVPELPALRLYYLYRNMTYFFLYEYFDGNIFRFLRFASWMPRHIVKLALSGQFLPEITSCLRGLSDGLQKKMFRRY